MAAPGLSAITVRFDLPPGWIEIPRRGQRPVGLLRRDPFDSVARRLSAQGSVVRPMIGPTAAYLQRLAEADPPPLGMATFIEVPARDRHTFVTFAVFAGPKQDQEPLEELASRPGPGDSPREVETVDLPWGPAARACYTRARHHGNGDPRPFVQFWVAPRTLDRLVIAVGDIDAPPDEPVDTHISDIDHLARTLSVTPM